jgi:hypothetical protein
MERPRARCESAKPFALSLREEERQGAPRFHRPTNKLWNRSTHYGDTYLSDIPGDSTDPVTVIVSNTVAELR